MSCDDDDEDQEEGNKDLKDHADADRQCWWF